MTVEIRTANGSQLFVSADGSDFTNVCQVYSLPALDQDKATIDVTLLKDTVTREIAGLQAPITWVVPFYWNTTDPGFMLIKTAFDSTQEQLLTFQVDIQGTSKTVEFTGVITQLTAVPSMDQNSATEGTFTVSVRSVNKTEITTPNREG